MDELLNPSVPPHHSIRRRRKKRKRRDRWRPWLLLPVVVAAFLIGHWWYSESPSEPGAGLGKVPDPAARAAALDAMDEAVRAKHEKRTAGILSALDRARRLDPNVPGLDIVFAETALNEARLDEMRAAANAAKKKGDHLGDAELLLGLGAWFARGPGQKETAAAADTASVHLAEAVAVEPFAAQAWFFWGDILRSTGRAKEGHERAIGALHRLQPWESSDVLAGKMIFAAAEAGDRVFVDLVAVPDSQLRQVLGKWAAQQGGLVGAPAAKALLPYTSQRGVQSLSYDLFSLARGTAAERSDESASLNPVLPVLPRSEK